MPPSTDADVATRAMRQARLGCASTMGITNASGGIGKNELSAKAIAASAGSAWRLAESAMIQSYIRRSIQVPRTIRPPSAVGVAAARGAGNWVAPALHPAGGCLVSGG